jgi:UDP-4-amino-4,6-dideoxy-N-acetyl-beta-L-altrosamine N-acetyltransferase
MNLITLRPVELNDSDSIRNWRNRDEIRQWMYTSRLISESEHQKWFEEMKIDPARRLLIIELNQTPQAVIYFSNIDQHSSSCDWGFYPTPHAIQGVSALIEFIALKFAFENLQIRRLQCQVLASNSGVLNLHKKSGFDQEGVLRQAKKTARGLEDVVLFGMLDSEWNHVMEALVNRLKKLLPYQIDFKI